MPTGTPPADPRGAAPPAPTVGRRSRLARAAQLLVNTVTLLAAAAFLALALGPHLLGYRTLTMRTGSMQPLAAPGDLLIVAPEPVRAVRAGQVLTFTAPLPGAPVLTHRVLSVEHRDDGTAIRTRGDANPGPDPWLARLTDPTAWRLVAVVPAVGWAIAALHHPAVHLLTVWLLPAWLCAQVLRALWRRPAAPATPTAAPITTVTPARP